LCKQKYGIVIVKEEFMYKILQKVSGSVDELWKYVKVDDTSTTDFMADTEEDLKTKLKELLNDVSTDDLEIVSPVDIDIVIGE